MKVSVWRRGFTDSSLIHRESDKSKFTPTSVMTTVLEGATAVGQQEILHDNEESLGGNVRMNVPMHRP